MLTFLFWIVHCGIWDRCIMGFVRLVSSWRINHDLVSWYLTYVNNWPLFCPIWDCKTTLTTSTGTATDNWTKPPAPPANNTYRTMMSWHRNAFRITGPLWGIHRRNSLHKSPEMWNFSVFFAVSLWNTWASSRVVDDLRRHNARVTSFYWNLVA